MTTEEVPKLVWSDVTSYSSNDTERVPRTMETRLGSNKLSVSNHIDLPTGMFRVYCYGYLEFVRDIEAEDLVHAQIRAEELFRSRVKALYKQVEAAFR